MKRRLSLTVLTAAIIASMGGCDFQCQANAPRDPVAEAVQRGVNAVDGGTSGDVKVKIKETPKP